MSFLPITIEELEGTADFIMVSPDAYVDHPSFGSSLIARFVQSKGFSVGIIAQPQNDADFRKLGIPKYGFLLSGGVVDSMVNNYTAHKKKRTNDEYSPGNKGFMRPDRATTVYAKSLKRLFPNCPIIAGGIEGSLRRFAHYDYWADEVMPSILSSAPIDLLIYGFGEKPMSDILEKIKKGWQIPKIRDVRGTCYLSSFSDLSQAVKDNLTSDKKEYVVIDGFEKVKVDKKSYAKAFKIQAQNLDAINGFGLIQEQEKGMYLIHNKPSFPMTTGEMDEVYALKYERDYHPSYKELGGVKAVEEVKFSITSHRGCFGSCSFCALTYAFGRSIIKRSEESILAEAELLTTLPDFKGYINDVGGPTANFRNPSCKEQLKNGVCKNKYCIGENPCKNLEVDHSEYLSILQKMRRIPRIKKVFIRSGIRFDYLMKDKNPQFFDELVKYHISGQLKVAPEHASKKVLTYMNKPSFDVYKEFASKYKRIDDRNKTNQFIVPYFISSHPGCELKDAVMLTEYLKSINYMPLQVQDFYPTPSTRSTTMYHTGIDPITEESVHVPKGEEKEMQRALLQYRKKENFDLIRKALNIAGRKDLIGDLPKCLVKTTNFSRINKTRFNKTFPKR